VLALVLLLAPPEIRSRACDGGAELEPFLLPRADRAACGRRQPGLPPEAVAYLDRLRQLELPKRAIELEREAWMLVAADADGAEARSDRYPGCHRRSTSDLVEAADWEADDPRLPAFADRLVSLIEESVKGVEDYDSARDFALDDDLVEFRGSR
jgi:hypothetical protein